MKLSLLLAPAAALCLSACTSNLAVNRYDSASPATGMPYRLKLTQYEVALTWRVVSCTVGQQKPLKIKIGAEIKDKTALDPDQFYIVDPRSLQGMFRNTEFAMEWYSDRGLKSINSSVDDQTGAAITNVLTGAVKLAGAGLVPGGASKGIVCPEKILTTLEQINGKGKKEGQQAKVDRVKKAVDEQTLVLARLTAKAAAAGNAVDNATRRRLARAEETLYALTQQLTAEQKALKELVDVVSETRTVTWPRVGTEFASVRPVLPSSEALARWGTDAQNLDLAIWFRLVPADGTTVRLAEAQRAANGHQPRRALNGLPYREPQLMRLEICSGAPCEGTREELLDKKALVKDAETLVLQAGPLLYLPFQGRTFANIKSSAGFSEAGTLTTAGTSQLRSPGVGASEAFKSGAEQVAALVDASLTADTKRLQAITAEAKARKELADAEAALEPVVDAEKKAAIAAFQTDASLAAAERSKIEAELALAAARRQLEP